MVAIMQNLKNNPNPEEYNYGENPKKFNKKIMNIFILSVIVIIKMMK